MSQPELNRSIWSASAASRSFASGTLPGSADVCIVGAGIAGLSVAYELAQAGLSVVVIDDGPIGRGQTAQTTAHLSSVIDDRFSEIERIHGTEAVRLAHESHAAAIRRIEEIVAAESIACDFARVDGYLVPARPDHAAIIDQEVASLQKAGITDYERLAQSPLSALASGPCLKFAGQGQFHPLKYLNGLASAIERRGGRIVTGRHVRSIRGGTPAEVDVRAGEVGEADSIVRAGAVVVATNSPIHLTMRLHTKQAPYLSYVVGLRIKPGSVPGALFWDTSDPYHYVRTEPLNQTDDLLIVGGEDHKTGHPADPAARYQALETWARERFPESGAVTHRWCGQVQETIDGLGLIGRCPSGAANVFIATGDSGMGMTHGVVAGLLIGDLIRGRDNPWVDLYEPSRKPVRALDAFVSENLDVALQYTDLVTGGEVASVDEIPTGSGAILRRGMTKVAAFRDNTGAVTERSAICPHLGCVVHWNPAGPSWDCPCHGSRFDPQGRVIVGPANTDLAEAE